MVQFNIDGKILLRLSINEELDILTQNEYESFLMDKNGNLKALAPPPEPEIRLPIAKFKQLDDYDICDAPQRPNAYIRFIEKSADELDGEVEYDVDEEDTTWLSIMNEQRDEQNLNPISVDTLELLMDRLEKESYFQVSWSMYVYELGSHNGGFSENSFEKLFVLFSRFIFFLVYKKPKKIFLILLKSF
jgi:bromodomain and PHD finger-containing protein 1